MRHKSLIVATIITILASCNNSGVMFTRIDNKPFYINDTDMTRYYYSFTNNRVGIFNFNNGNLSKTITLPGQILSWQVNNYQSQNNIFIIYQTDYRNKLICIEKNEITNDWNDYAKLWEIDTEASIILKLYSHWENNLNNIKICCQTIDKKSLYYYDTKGKLIFENHFDKPSIIANIENKSNGADNEYLLYDGASIRLYNANNQISTNSISLAYDIEKAFFVTKSINNSIEYNFQDEFGGGSWIYTGTKLIKIASNLSISNEFEFTNIRYADKYVDNNIVLVCDQGIIKIDIISCNYQILSKQADLKFLDNILFDGQEDVYYLFGHKVANNITFVSFWISREDFLEVDIQPLVADLDIDKLYARAYYEKHNILFWENDGLQIELLSDKGLFTLNSFIPLVFRNSN